MLTSTDYWKLGTGITILLLVKLSIFGFRTQNPSKQEQTSDITQQFNPGEGIIQPIYNFPEDLNLYKDAGTVPNIPILWITSVTLYDGTSGFANEVVSFIIPVTKQVRVGWLNIYNDDYSFKNEPGHKFQGARKINIIEEQISPDRLRLQQAQNEAELLKDVSPKIIVFQTEPVFIKNYLNKLSNYVKLGDYIVLRAMFETDRLPNKWAEIINENVDEVWVPTNFSKSVFLREGVKKKVSVLGEGYNPAVFNTRRAKSKVKACCKDGDYVFLAVGKNEVRKGWSSLIESYAKTFYSSKARVPVCLIVSANGASVVEDLYNPLNLRLGHKLPPHPTMCSVPQLDLQQYADLFKSANVFVLPTRGEGWGRPVMEAMASGLPVIVPYWGGVTEYVTPHNSIPVRVGVLEAAYKEETHLLGGSKFYGKHQWATINVTELGRALMWTFNNRYQAMDIGRRAEKDMLDNWTREKLADTVRAHVARIEKHLNTS